MQAADIQTEPFDVKKARKALPKLRRLNVFTLGGWLERRYSPVIGIMYSITWSVIWMLFNLGLYLYAGALVLNTLVGWLL